MRKKKTTEEYKAELEIKNPKVTLLEEYFGSKFLVKFQCEDCGNIWKARPSDTLRGHGCPKCAGVMKKTHEQYLKELKAINSNINVLEDYINNNKKIAHKCQICGYIWSSAPTNTLRGEGCPKCAGVLKKTHEEYINELKDINPDIEVIGEYINNKNKIVHKCLWCSFEWLESPNHVLSGRGCPKCRNKK